MCCSIISARTPMKQRYAPCAGKCAHAHCHPGRVLCAKGNPFARFFLCSGHGHAQSVAPATPRPRRPPTPPTPAATATPTPPAQTPAPPTQEPTPAPTPPVQEPTPVPAAVCPHRLCLFFRKWSGRWRVAPGPLQLLRCPFGALLFAGALLCASRGGPMKSHRAKKQRKCGVQRACSAGRGPPGRKWRKPGPGPA